MSVRLGGVAGARRAKWDGGWGGGGQCKCAYDVIDLRNRRELGNRMGGACRCARGVPEGDRKRAAPGFAGGGRRSTKRAELVKNGEGSGPYRASD